MTPKNKILGRKIRELRKKRGLKQEQLAEIMNERFELKTDRPTISKWETGFQEPTTYNLKCIAEILNVSLDYLNSNDMSNNEDKLSPYSEYDDNQKWVMDTSKDRAASKQLRDIWKAIHGHEQDEF